MPNYDYRCDHNGRTIEASHPMSESITTWGQLCAATGIDLGPTPPDAPVDKVVSLVAARNRSDARPPKLEGPCGSSCGCFPN